MDNIAPSDKQLRTEKSPIDDISYLARSDHRVPTLVAFTVRPRGRSERWEMAGVSSSTLRRTLDKFEECNRVRKRGYQYEATRLGAFVASAMTDLTDRTTPRPFQLKCEFVRSG